MSNVLDWHLKALTEGVEGLDTVILHSRTETLFKRVHYIFMHIEFKLDGEAPLMTDPPQCNFTTSKIWQSNHRNDPVNASGPEEDY